LFLFYIRVPNPPFPPDSGGAQGLEVSLGTDNEGSGDNPAALTASVNKVQNTPAPSAPDDNHVVTSDVEETANLKHTEKKVNKKHAEKVIEVVKPPAPQPSSDLMKAMASWDNNSKKVSGGHGSGEKAGNQGDPNGNPNAKGSGIPGDGMGGTGPGGLGGPGPGGPGSGTGAHLKNRHLVVPATLISNQQEEGVVVVVITVDKDGNVTEAHARAKGSTTTNALLWSTARQAALNAKFDKNPDGVSDQQGIYIFNFSFK
jgi:protein TonB